LTGVYQVHSPTCVTVDAPWGHDERPEADALVTNRPNILLSIVTADCAPVLLTDRAAGVIGAAHAGWRGALGGITDATIVSMIRLGARVDRIAAAVGPCIARASYEVDQTFLGRFAEADPLNERFFTDGPAHKPHFDLEAYVAARLAAAGVQRIETLGLDTYADEARFYSFRRSTHRGEPAYGRQISLIALPLG
jgi:YfiH family protein